MAKQLALVLLVAVVAAAATSVAAATKLTLHNLCPYPVWPLVTPNTGFPSISGNTARLDGGGRGLVSYDFPASFWAGRVVARTGCGGGGRTGAANAGAGSARRWVRGRPERPGARGRSASSAPAAPSWRAGARRTTSRPPVPADEDDGERRRARAAALLAPGELKVVFCQPSMVAAAVPELIRTVVANI
ncbi:hypothetical protein OsJ_36562 [Oryza sativa Japonica Group]|uniref:Uncharacterized protein n=1 Tax=Oryza sativa subsp. japonica TaxID=39947 RepID=A3CIK8_ORYSJ|nr:hypothetical protein OsJ_36562 [Oryza sativa Japonica Group]